MPDQHNLPEGVASAAKQAAVAQERARRASVTQQPEPWEACVERAAEAGARAAAPAIRAAVVEEFKARLRGRVERIPAARTAHSISGGAFAEPRRAEQFKADVLAALDQEDPDA